MKKIKLVCPACSKWRSSHLLNSFNFLLCPLESCSHKYEIYNGIPVLLTKSGDALRLNKRVNLKMRPDIDGVY